MLACCMIISIWSITYEHYDKIIDQSLNTCIILVGVGRIYSIQGGGGGQKGGGIFSKFRGELAKKGGVKKFRGVWTLDEAMRRFATMTF